MKFLIISPDWFPNITGFGLSAYEFAYRLEKDGHKVVIITPSNKNIDKKGMNVIQVKKLFNLFGRNPIVFGLRKKILQHAKDCDAILLYSYMYEMNARVSFFKSLRLLKKPIILMYRGSLENYVMPFLGIIDKIGKFGYDNTFGRYLFRHVDYIISNSKPTLEVIKKRFKVKSEVMAYVPSAVEVSNFKKSSLNNKRVLFIGRLIKNKGIHFFDEIAHNIPKDWKFSIIGDGPLQEHVKHLTGKHPHIEFYGKMSYEKTKELLEKSDILILPTFAEGSPRVVLEACSAGVPSVVFDVGDVPTLLNKDQNGFCIERYNIKDFISKMKLLIENEELRKKMGENAYDYARKNLDWSIVYKKTLEEIKKGIEKAKK